MPIRAPPRRQQVSFSPAQQRHPGQGKQNLNPCQARASREEVKDPLPPHETSCGFRLPFMFLASLEPTLSTPLRLPLFHCALVDAGGETVDLASKHHRQSRYQSKQCKTRKFCPARQPAQSRSHVTFPDRKVHVLGNVGCSRFGRRAIMAEYNFLGQGIVVNGCLYGLKDSTVSAVFLPVKFK